MDRRDRAWQRDRLFERVAHVSRRALAERVERAERAVCQGDVNPLVTKASRWPTADCPLLLTALLCLAAPAAQVLHVAANPTKKAHLAKKQAEVTCVCACVRVRVCVFVCACV